MERDSLVEVPDSKGDVELHMYAVRCVVGEKEGIGLWVVCKIMVRSNEQE